MSRIIPDEEIRDTICCPQTSRDGATRLRAVAIAQRNASDREKLLEAGCDAYLSKPINTRELPEVISEMLFPPPKDKPGPEGDNVEPEDSSH